MDMSARFFVVTTAIVAFALLSIVFGLLFIWICVTHFLPTNGFLAKLNLGLLGLLGLGFVYAGSKALFRLFHKR